MNDDFNTPIALSVLFELAKEIRREGNQLVHQGQPDLSVDVLQQQYQTLVKLAEVLGLEVSFEAVSPEPAQGWSDGEIEALIQQRLEARQAKNFAEGDRIRNELQSQGITLIDQPGGVTRWHRG